MRIGRKITSFLLIIVLLSSLTVYADELNNYKDKNNELRDQIKETQNEILKNKSEKENIYGDINKLDEQIIVYEDQLLKLDNEIIIKKQAIEETEKQIEKALEDENKQYKNLNSRIKYMYENNTSSYIEIILSSKNISDLFNRLDYMKAIMNHDKDIFANLKLTREEIEEEERKLIQEKTQVVELKEKTESQNYSIKVAKDKKKSALLAVQEDINSQQGKINDLEKAQNEINEIIKRIENSRKYSGGKFEWPVPGYYRLSSPFGWRNDPFTGERWFHKGIDIPAGYGKGVNAAADGKVICAGWVSGYGNTVMIDHGSKIVTLYGHNSSVTVKAGQEVKRGQQVAKIGSTGRSTGNHSHFGVLINNKPVQPLDYLKK